METIELNEEVAKALKAARGRPVRVVAPSGRVQGYLVPQETLDLIEHRLREELASKAKESADYANFTEAELKEIFPDDAGD